MMKKGIILVLFLTGFLFISIAFAQDASLNSDTSSTSSDSSSSANSAIPSPITQYKPVYFITGDIRDQVKIQISFKYNLLNLFDFRKFGLYAAYSQDMFWQLYNSSSPFNQINFNPELFWKLETKNNIFNDADLGFLDYLQLGLYEHKSNGEEGEESRGYDRSYIAMQLSYGTYLNFGVMGKYFYIYDSRISDNPDIMEYMGSFEGKAFIKIQDPKTFAEYGQLYCSFGFGGGRNGFDVGKGWQEFGIKCPSLFNLVRPYIQVYNGYGESILNYNRKADHLVVRVGVIFE